MIGAKNVPPSTVDGWFAGFMLHHHDPSTRRLRAKTLIPNGEPPEHWDHPSRTVLVAQWADKPDQARETARLLYSLSPTLSYYAGQSVLRLAGVSFAEIKNLRKGGELPPHRFSIDIGVIDEDTHPEYGFRKTPRHLIPPRVSPDATCLDYQVTLPVVPGGSIDVNPDGQVEINPPLGERTDFVAYAGRVCLEASHEFYQRTRQTEVGSLVFGNGRSFGVVYELLEHIDGPEKQAFQESLANREVTPNQPLLYIDSLAA